MKRLFTSRCGVLGAAVVSLALCWPVAAQAQSSTQMIDIANMADTADAVTFDDIYANPGDQNLNLTFAVQQAKAGNLVSAASALERMLFLQPNWDSARLFYALTLYQLDDRDAATRELQLLDRRPLTPEQRAKLERYQRGFKEDNKGRDVTKARLSGRIALGLRYDDNAGNALGDVVFGGSKDPEISGNIQAVARYNIPLTADGSTRAFIRGDLQTRRHETESEADFDVYGLEAGFGGRLGGINWTLSADAMTVNISSDSYIDQIGAKAKIRGAFTERFLWNLSGEYYDQNFKELPFTFGEADRSGGKYVLDAGLEFNPNDKTLIGVNVAYEDKGARDDALAYDGLRLRGLLSYAFNGDAYFRGTVEYRKLDYKGNSPFLFPFAPREDENIKARVAVGMNANRILEALEIGPSDILRPVSFELGGNYVDRKTNIPSSGFENLGGELKMIVEF